MHAQYASSYYGHTCTYSTCAPFGIMELTSPAMLETRVERNSRKQHLVLVGLGLKFSTPYTVLGYLFSLCLLEQEFWSRCHVTYTLCHLVVIIISIISVMSSCNSCNLAFKFHPSEFILASPARRDHRHTPYSYTCRRPL